MLLRSWTLRYSIEETQFPVFLESVLYNQTWLASLYSFLKISYLFFFFCHWVRITVNYGKGVKCFNLLLELREMKSMYVKWISQIHFIEWLTHPSLPWTLLVIKLKVSQLGNPLNHLPLEQDHISQWQGLFYMSSLSTILPLLLSHHNIQYKF